MNGNEYVISYLYILTPFGVRECNFLCTSFPFVTLWCYVLMLLWLASRFKFCYTCKSRQKCLTIFVYKTATYRIMSNLDEYMLSVCPLIILLAGDIHLNPGPGGDFHDLSLCHCNIRSLSNEKMRSIRSDIASNFDIITLSETFLTSNF